MAQDPVAEGHLAKSIFRAAVKFDVDVRRTGIAVHDDFRLHEVGIEKTGMCCCPQNRGLETFIQAMVENLAGNRARHVETGAEGGIRGGGLVDLNIDTAVPDRLARRNVEAGLPAILIPGQGCVDYWLVVAERL